ncbi:hypothetical protein A2Z33_05345 [Candidatus Gottesmanbacteria bacterium RBG_16_52_11]|uniref:BioF2-like acetyltransferase domain-containing protein n=1 Tax=Candidatus Gottesmanbacteria bacterium RBG_16_52_11 TaxID=1798374 RepID=A0A1F5YMA3_9BACT|nr:MAG: hypothetical protein A2Z33_05345 [Candidatus Gottesmanbacteria bacterium RBG_16_52_11]
MAIREATPADRDIWDKTADHPLQSWAWGDFRRSLGIDTVRLLKQTGNSPSACQMTFHALPHLPLTVGYCPKSKLPDTGLLQSLKNTGIRKNAIFIQMEPDAVVSINGKPDRKMPTAVSRMLRTDPRLRSSHRPLFPKYTFVLDLTMSENELLDKMHHKTRYNIRLAQKHGVIVRENNSADGFSHYLRLTGETLARQGFYAHDEKYHRMMWQYMHRAGTARLFTASRGGRILTAWIIFAWKSGIYYPYGASSREDAGMMAPNLTLWEIVRWAKARGYKTFDLWGAMGPNPDRRDPWYGFHRFKEGYAPDLVEFAGSFDLVLRPLIYPVYTAADTVRWRLLKSRRR